MKNPAKTLMLKAVNMRQHLVDADKSKRNPSTMLRIISRFKRYADHWTNKPEALRGWLLRHEAEFNQLIPPTPQGDSLKTEFLKIVTL